MGKFGMGRFLKGQRMTPLPVKEHDLSGQVVIVTGSNVGLGFEAAKHFARMNPERLIMACRNQKLADEALKALRHETGYAGGEVWILDHGDFKSVTRFAEKVDKELHRLDLLVANVGMTGSKYNTTKDGFETILQVNHLATALLSLLLLPKMIATEPLRKAGHPRLVIVSSEVHGWTSFDKPLINSGNVLETLSNKEYCTAGRMRGRYFESKLLNVFFTRALASYFPASTTPVIIDTVNPGLCQSSLMSSSDMPWIVMAGSKLMAMMLAKSAEVGSRQLVWAALEGKDEEMHGEYVSNFRTEEASDFVLENGKLQAKIWNETIEILGKAEPRVLEIVQQLKR